LSEAHFYTLAAAPPTIICLPVRLQVFLWMNADRSRLQKLFAEAEMAGANCIARGLVMSSCLAFLR
jgi:hypothetical protein